jgi:hypothetical protein
MGGIVAVGAAGAFAAVGCSGGGSSSSGGDGGNDATADVVHADTFAPDVHVNEAGEAGKEAGDAGPTDSSLTPAQFPGAAGVAFCNQFSKCCFGGNPPPGQFDMNACISSFVDQGFDTTGVNAQGAYLTSAVQLDQAKAQSCIADINAIDCTANLVTSAQWKKILSDCVTALVGTLEAGAPCTAPVQCNSGSFCDLPLDGGTSGTCQPLRPVGGNCGDFGGQTPGQAEEACSYRRSGSNGQFCHSADLVSGVTYDAASQWLCDTAQGLDASCNVDINCQTSICDIGDGSLYLCSNSSAFIYPFECTAFPGGGGG